MTINTEATINIIYKFITAENKIRYKNLKDSFDNYIAGLLYEAKERVDINTPSFYAIIDPLLSLGCVDYGYENGELIFYIPERKTIKNNDKYYKISNILPYYLITCPSDDFIELKPIQLLKAMKSVVNTCNTLPESSTMNYLYKYNNKNKKLETYCSKSPYLGVGIYKKQPFDNANLVLINSKHKNIQRKSENYDSLNYCFCYVDIYDKKKLFEFHKKKQELKVYTIFLPVLIKRALFMCDINNFKATPSQVSKKMKFKNITLEIVEELKRIFSSESMEVIDD